MLTSVFENKLTTTEIIKAFILQWFYSDKLRELFALDPTMTNDRRRELETNLERIAVNRDVNVVKPRYSEVLTNNLKNLYRNRNQPQLTDRIIELLKLINPYSSTRELCGTIQ